MDFTLKANDDEISERREALEVMKIPFEDDEVVITAEQLDKMEEALLNPLVLQEIVKCLDYPSHVKSCRVVSHLWNKISSQELQKRDCFKVNLMYNHVTKEYCAEKCELDADPGIFTLTQLTCFLNPDSSLGFPCTEFEFFGRIGSDCSDLFDFFHVFGSQIQTLRLVEFSGSSYTDDEDEETSEERDGGQLTSQDIQCSGTDSKRNELWEILKMVGPTVKYLHLQNVNGWDEMEDQSPILFPALKVFQQHNSSEISLRILKQAPYLQIVNEFSMINDLQVILDSNKVNAVKDIYSYSFKQLQLEQFFNLVSSMNLKELKLEKICMTHFLTNPEFWSSVNQLKYIDALQSLLFQCKDTLEILNLNPVELFLNRLTLPTFIKLRMLKLGPGRTLDPHPIFPSRLNLTETFPNVRELDFTDIHCDDDETWNLYFPPPDSHYGKFSTVQRVQIPQLYTEVWLVQIRNLCPNFESVQLWDHYYETNQTEVTSMLPLLFTNWTHLKTIEIEIADDELSASELVSAFTGLAKEDCVTILGQMESQTKNMVNIDLCQFDVCRPSLVNLPELKHLSIRFWNVFPPDAIQFLCSWASKFHKNLKISVEFNHNLLEPIELESIYKRMGGLVNVRHNPECFDLNLDEHDDPARPQFNLNSLGKVYKLII